jgi:hypothetical protein
LTNSFTQTHHNTSQLQNSAFKESDHRDFQFSPHDR